MDSRDRLDQLIKITTIIYNKDQQTQHSMTTTLDKDN